MFRFLFRLVGCGWIGGGGGGNLQLLVVGLPDPCFVFSFISELPPALVHFLFHLGTLVRLLSHRLELVPPQITLWPNYHFCPCNRVSMNPFKEPCLSRIQIPAG